MGKLKKFEIQFQGDVDEYYQGDQIHGRVVIEPSEEIPYKDLKVRVSGKGEIEWGSGHLFRDKVLNETVLERPPGKLDPGISHIPFSYGIPRLAEPSYVDSADFLQYKVACDVKRTALHKDYRTKKWFKILPAVNEDVVHRSCPWDHAHMLEQWGCLGCNPGTVTISLALDRVCFYPGDVIRFRAEVHNGARRRIKKCVVTFYRATTYWNSSERSKKWRTKKEKICSVSRPEVPGKTSGVWSSEAFKVPESSLPTCSYVVGIIDVVYFVKIKVVNIWPHRNLHVKLPVFIGAISRAQRAQREQARSPPTDTAHSAIGYVNLGLSETPL